MPAPSTIAIESTPDLSFETFCSLSTGTVSFSVEGRSPGRGLLQCDPREATIVFFDSRALRIRQIRVAKAGAIVDDLFYVSPDSTPTLQILAELKNALAQTDPSHISTHARLLRSKP